MRYKCAATVAPVEPSTPLPSSVARPTLRAVTYNVLFDKFESDRIRTSERHPVVCEVLRRTQADVMVLCEATASFAAVLLACPWVRERYWVSDCPGGATLGECGQLILSRFPMAVQVAALSRYKMAVVASVSFGTLGELSVGGVHLPSNFADVLDGSLGVSAALQRRRQTMLALVAHLVQVPCSGARCFYSSVFFHSLIRVFSFSPFSHRCLFILFNSHRCLFILSLMFFPFFSFSLIGVLFILSILSSVSFISLHSLINVLSILLLFSHRCSFHSLIGVLFSGQSCR